MLRRLLGFFHLARLEFLQKPWWEQFVLSEQGIQIRKLFPELITGVCGKDGR